MHIRVQSVIFGVVSCMHVLSVQKAVNPTKCPIFRDLFSMRVAGYKGGTRKLETFFLQI